MLRRSIPRAHTWWTAPGASSRGCRGKELSGDTTGEVAIIPRAAIGQNRASPRPPQMPRELLNGLAPSASKHSRRSTPSPTGGLDPQLGCHVVAEDEPALRVG